MWRSSEPSRLLKKPFFSLPHPGTSRRGFHQASFSPRPLKENDAVVADAAASQGRDGFWRAGVGRVRRMGLLAILTASSNPAILLQFTSSTHSNGRSPVG